MTTSLSAHTAEEPSGIGGWLILPLLGFVGTIVLTAWSLAEAGRAVSGMIAIFTATSGPLGALKLPMAASLVGGLLAVATAAFCLYLIFAGKHAIIKFATAHYLILLGASLADVWAQYALETALPNSPADPAIMRDAIRSLFVACIWIPYFHVSTRVKNTFPAVGMPLVAARSDNGTLDIRR